MTTETEQTQQPTTQTIADPHLLYYAKLGGECVQNISRQLETNDFVATIHHFEGQNRTSYRKWRKDLARAALENNPVDDIYMRKLVSRTVKDTASDFWSELRTQNPGITWSEIQTAFDNRFRTFVDSQLAKQKLPRLRQEKRETLHSFAQRILDTAREAYTDTQIAREVVCENLREIFLNGMLDLKSSQRIIRESPKDLTTALDSAIREEMLNESFKIRHANVTDSEGRRVVPMEIDMIKAEATNGDSHPTKKDFDDLVKTVASISSAVKNRQGQDNKVARERADSQVVNVSSNGTSEHFENSHRNQDQHVNHNGNRYQRNPHQKLRYTPGTEFVPRGAYNSHQQHSAYQQTPQSAPPYNPAYHNSAFNPSAANYGSFPPRRQDIPQSYRGAVYYNAVQPNNSMTYHNKQPRSGSQPNRAARFSWIPDNIPICGHCNKPGHMMKTCFTLHPELRPNRSTWQSMPQKN